MRRAALGLVFVCLLSSRAPAQEAQGATVHTLDGREATLESLRDRGWWVLVAPGPDGLTDELAEQLASASAALVPFNAGLLLDPDGGLVLGYQTAGLPAEGPACVVLDPGLELREVLPMDDPAGLAARVEELQRATTSVDLRPVFARFGLPVRRQGRRPTCSVVTTTGALEFALAVQRGEGTPLSVEYLNWACNDVINNHSRDRGQFFHHLLQGFERHGLCSQEAMPYTRRWDPELVPDPDAVAEARDVLANGLRPRWIKRNGTPRGANPDELAATLRALASGLPVASGSYHSLLLVGYRLDPELPGGGEFTTHDSGPGAARTMSFEEASRRLNDIFWVEAAPSLE
jgi:hypothetical protein